MIRRERPQAEANLGRLPQRLDQAEAIEQAVMLADRYQRASLRLLQTLRDQRQLFDGLAVTSGQLNIAERQINKAEKSGDT